MLFSVRRVTPPASIAEQPLPLSATIVIMTITTLTSLPPVAGVLAVLAVFATLAMLPRPVTVAMTVPVLVPHRPPP